MQSSITHRSLLPLAAVIMLAGSSLAQNAVAPQSAAAEEIHAENCMVGYIRKVNVPAEAQGKIIDMKVEEGMTVKAGDLMAQLDDTQAKLNLDLKKAEEEEAILNATNEVNLKDATNAEQLASEEYLAYKELRKAGATPYWEVEKKRLESERAKLRIDLAKMNMEIAKSQYFAKRSETRIVEDEITRRQVKAPFDGFIETRIAQPGEWVQPGSPIAMVVQMDELRVEGDVDALRYSQQVTMGTPAKVLIHNRLSGEGKPIEIDTKIGYVSTEIDLNNRYRVWVTVPNTRVGEADWQIKPGMRAEIIIKPATAAF
jgi:multidrug efflux pump subunit AcrA (membrane-fusion protein)